MSTWVHRTYRCGFCDREFRSAQALGGHMNVHRKLRADLRSSSSCPSSSSLLVPCAAPHSSFSPYLPSSALPRFQFLANAQYNSCSFNSLPGSSTLSNFREEAEDSRHQLAVSRDEVLFRSSERYQREHAAGEDLISRELLLTLGKRKRSPEHQFMRPTAAQSLKKEAEGDQENVEESLDLELRLGTSH